MKESKHHPHEDVLMSEALRVMERIEGIIDRIESGEASEEEIAEIKAIDEKIARTPEGMLGGG